MGSQTLFRGPVVNAGSLMNTTTQGEVVGPFDGPDISYQGLAIPDPRNTPLPKDTLSPGAVPSFYASPLLVTYDGIPQQSFTNTVATTQIVTAGNTLTLNTVNATVNPTDDAQVWTYGIPLVPQGTSSVVIVGAIDFGFATGTTVANSSSVVVSDSRAFDQGQWLAIGGVGNSSSNTALITQVTGITNRTTITISPVAATARTRAPIGNASILTNVSLTPPASSIAAAVVPNAATGQLGAGLAAVFDSRYGAGRNLRVQGATANTTVLTVVGYDVHGNYMTESITVAGGTTITSGLKAFKYIASITAGGTNATGVAVGLGDLFGFAWRSDSYGLTVVRSNFTNVLLPVASYSPAITGPSTATSADVRGTVNLAATFTSNGTSRLTIAAFPSADQVVNATPIGYTSLFGVPQA